MDPATDRPICNPVQSQTSCSARSDSLGSRRHEPVMGESGRVRLSSSSSTQPSDLKGSGSGLSQNDPDNPRVVIHLWIILLRRISHCVQKGLYVTTATGPRISVKVKTWFLCASRRVFKKISFLLPSLPGSNKQCYFATSSQM